jgi:hypothetical protein
MHKGDEHKTLGEGHYPKPYEKKRDIYKEKRGRGRILD